MSSLIFISLSLSISLVLPMMAQPLSLGLIIMLSTLFLCLISALTLSSWYGYILFLIYVGGLLVMFAYVSALSPNMLFSTATPLLYFMFMVIISTMIVIYQPILDSGSIFMMDTYLNNKNMKVSSSEMVSSHTISILLGLALILLMNLVTVIKICYYQHASMRPFNTS